MPSCIILCCLYFSLLSSYSWKNWKKNGQNFLLPHPLPPDLQEASRQKWQKEQQLHQLLVGEGMNQLQMEVSKLTLLPLVSSVGRVPVFWAGGFEFKPWLDQHSGSLNNWEESAAFVMTSAFLVFMDNDEILQVLSHSTFTSLVLVRHKRTHATVQKEWGM